MAKLLNREQRLVTGVTSLLPVGARVLSLEIDWTAAGQYFAISEAFGNDFYLLSVRVWAIWKTTGIGPIIDFRITTGTGKAVDYGIVSGQWEHVIPVLMEGRQTSWVCTPNQTNYCWTLCKRFSGQGRRLGISCQQFDDSSMYFYCSFEVSEG